ncbi:MAG TPA: hypothetical protein VLT61_08760 [Anaeromyxobacteraceae bacterium]|nr:hypothetical protein [Anaeromyxobacteraceae bacterium]
MRRPVLALVAALAVPAAALAQDQGPGAAGGAPTGLAASFSFGGGAELGLEKGKAGVLEMEAAVGYEIGTTGIRPEMGAAFGLAPDSHVALRPGLRWTLPGFPIQLRAAVDASNARGATFGFRWLLVGAAGELRLTSLLGLFAEVDTGAPLSSDAGLPLLVRAGASFRF